MHFPEIRGLETIESPALLFIEEIIDANLREMLRMVGNDPTRLRPHIKTHKTAEIIDRHITLGIRHFKASTLSEAALCALRGAEDVLVAYPLQGPNLQHFKSLEQKFPNTRFSVLIDAPETILQLEELHRTFGTPTAVFLELDCGMSRTGIAPGESAANLYQQLSTAPSVRVRGLHAYDGHIHDADLTVRSQRCEADFQPVLELRSHLERKGFAVPSLIAGGSPTFGIHALHADRICSPGTTVMWDFGYGEKHPDLSFRPAAFLLCRVVSHPGSDRICLDLGHKSVAPENPHPRVRLQGLENAEVLMQSEEHLVLRVPNPSAFPLGTPILGIPRHVCPTVSMHDKAYPVRDGRPSAPWTIAARGRFLHLP
jgi:D-serine deaminase-like pyridoxal phosphate-dependent protein